MIVQTLCLLISAAISRSILRLNSLWALCPSCMTPLDWSQGTSIILLKQTHNTPQLGNFAKPIVNYLTIRIDLEMINEPSCLSFIWRIILRGDQCRDQSHLLQNSMTESLKVWSVWLREVLKFSLSRHAAKRMRAKTRVSSSTDSGPHISKLYTD